MLNIGILGLGNQGFSFLRSYSYLDNARLAAVCDLDNNKLEKAKKEFSDFNKNLVTTTNIDNFISSGLDIVTLCLPVYENNLIIGKILKKDINVLCSLPMSESIDSTNTIKEIIIKSKAKLMPAQLIEFFSSYNEFRNIIKRGKIGEVGFMRASIGGGYPGSYNDWLDSDEKGGGVILNLGIHALYYLISLFGSVKRVYARRKKIINGDNKKDYALILIRFNNESIVHLELTWAYPDGTPYISKLDAFGTNGQLNYDDTNKGPITLYENKIKNKSYDLYRDENPLTGNPCRLITESFIGYLEGRSEIPVKLEDSIYALNVVFCCLESANNNKVVKVPIKK
jgi:UDP-N-acetylglucosamine 3-dehydrogenase